jgi:hypothetical protein
VGESLGSKDYKGGLPAAASEAATSAKRGAATTSEGRCHSTHSEDTRLAWSAADSAALPQPTIRAVGCHVMLKALEAR